MDITIIGAGNMGRGISTRMLEGGNNVTLIDSDAEDARALAAELQEVASGGSTVSAGEGTLSGDVVILAVPYQTLTSVLEEYGDQFEGKIVVDITNPVNFETMDPLVEPGTSCAPSTRGRSGGHGSLRRSGCSTWRCSRRLAASSGVQSSSLSKPCWVWWFTRARVGA